MGRSHDLMDFTAVSTVAVPIGKLVPPPASGSSYKRIFVANGNWSSSPAPGRPSSVIVPSIDEALRRLGRDRPGFEPVGTLP